MQYADGIIKLVNCVWTGVGRKKKKGEKKKTFPTTPLLNNEHGSGELPWAVSVEQIHTTESSQTALTANPLAAPVHVTEGSLAQHTCQHTAHHHARVVCNAV